MSTSGTVPLDVLGKALQDANLPALQMALVHMTGERRWLEPPYLPTRGRGLDDNDDGGHPPAVQEELRAAALEAVAARRAGRLAPRRVDPDELAEMFAVAVAEDIGAEYGPLLADEIGLDLDGSPLPAPPDAPHRALSVLVVGAGASGIAAANELRAVGIDFTVIDKNEESGGTWFENRYPGCGCDSPSHLYSFRQRTNAGGWTRYYAGRDELQEYFTTCAREVGLTSRLRRGWELVRAEWQEDDNRWQVLTRHVRGEEETLVVDAIINATGMLNRPSIPAITGLERFTGPATHTARWPDDLDITGRRVAVIGTGASAMQVVPSIAGVASHVTVFQRSPQWAIPNPNYKREVTDATRLLMAEVPHYADWYRIRLHWIHGDRLHPALQVDPDWTDPDRSINATNDSVRRFLTDYITEQLGDRADELLPKTLPDYPPFGKRMLMDNRWFATMARPDVTLVTDAIETVRETSVLTVDGQEHPVDVILLATGFESRNYLGSADYIGTEGTSLRQFWGPDDARAYLGLTVPRFPNLFLLYGPNTNAHAGSVLFYSECQARYAARLLAQVADRGAAAVDIRPEVFDDYVRRVDDAHSRMVWTHPRVSTYYRNAQGRVVNNSPWRQVDYFAMTSHPDLDDYRVIPPGSPDR